MDIFLFMLLVKKLLYAKAAFINVKVNISLLKIRGYGFPNKGIGIFGFYGVPSDLGCDFSDFSLTTGENASCSFFCKRGGKCSELTF